MESAPQALFKYLPPGRITVLRDLLIRFSQSSSLNDTLELRPPIKGVAADETLVGIGVEKLAPTMWSDASAINRKTLGNKKILDRLCPGLADLAADFLLQTTAQKFAEAVKLRHEKNPHAVFDVADQNYGILSLTETPNDIPMWSHYADGGRGFLIEFDPNHAWFHDKREDRDSFRHLRKVSYVSSRPEKFLLDISELEFLYTKWSVWQSEREWRVIRSFNEAAKESNHADLYGNKIILFSIPPESIKCVVSGFSASREFQSMLHSILSENKALGHVNLKCAMQSSETGSVEIV